MALLDKLLGRVGVLRGRLTGDAAAPGPGKEAADRLIAEGNRAEAAGKARDACERYRAAVAAAPGYAKAHLNLGIGLEAAGDPDAAVECYERALAIDRGDPYASYNLGKLLHTRGEGARAEGLLRTALAGKPDFPEALVVLASVYESQGKTAQAAAALETALRQRPDWPGALFNYAAVLHTLKRLPEAEVALRRLIALEPGDAAAHGLLGNVLRGLVRLPEALEALATARRLDPERFDLQSAELFVLSCSDDVSDDALFERHRDYGARLEAAVAPGFAPLRNSREPERRLRIGYVSGDFYTHPVAFFAIPLFERHDRTRCEIYCYSTGPTEDRTTDEVRARADVWRDVASMSDSALAAAINQDGIDVLVDLSGHSGTFRIAVFAQQPAPVQLTWLGYLSTTGLTRIQYRLCDRHTDPAGMTDRWHTETLIRLPECQWCYRPIVSIDCAEAPPIARNGYVTFGSFNNALKISPSVRRLWAEILSRVPGSRIVFVGVPHGTISEKLLRDFENAGISPDRMEIAPRLGLAEYFGAFNAVDVALDTTPYSGGTTTCDTLWMGVPVITVPGERSISRSAASILATVGLDEWIAAGPEDYVEMAVKCAARGTAIAELRRTLRDRLRASPLMDERRFARDIEAAYREMWRAWCRGAAAPGAGASGQATGDLR
jgi:protein O-GlcNAc transferase